MLNQRKIYDFISLYEYVALLGLSILSIAGLNTYIAMIIVFQLLMKLPREVLRRYGYIGIDKVYHKFGGNLSFSVTDRPSQAFNCDMINQGGDASKIPGFPSGHTSVATYLYFVVLLEYLDDSTSQEMKKSLLPLLAVTLAFQFAVPFARYKSGCHTIPQLAGGFILGAVTALLFKKFDKDVMMKNERYANDKNKALMFFNQKF